MQERNAELEKKLAEKYGERAFMYTEYPNMRFWSKEIGDREYRRALAEFFLKNPDERIQLYVHFPYCTKMCWFCTCPVKISKDYGVAKRYLDFLRREIELLKNFCDVLRLKPNVREIHFGGGSPTDLKESDFDLLVESLAAVADISKVDELAIEIDPRHVKQDKIKYYRDKGINRISFGVQDFDIEVQRAVGRVQPLELTERLLTPEIRALFPNGINFDIICGLPKQTTETIRSTMAKVAALSPDRICFNYLHYRPDIFDHQNLMAEHGLPDNVQRKELFLAGLEVLERSGYLRVGYDHFAKPTDDLVSALKDKKIQWNRLGPAAGRYNSVVALGISGQTTLWPDWYFQNVQVSDNEALYRIAMDRYESEIAAGKFPIFHGYRLNGTDITRREIIHSLRNYFEVKMPLESWQNYFRKEHMELQKFAADGIVDLSDQEYVRITPLGQQFADKVCEVFDEYKTRA